MHGDDIVRLQAGALRLELAPAVGGSISAMWTDAGGRRIDWLRPATAQALEQRKPLGMASFPLVPFCNRIRDGHAFSGDREIRFPPNHPAEDSPHPLHGIGWQRAWKVTHGDESSATLALDVPAGPAWPWHFSSTQHVQVSAHGAVVTISMTNHDTVPMPAGIGHHPYFPHTRGTRVTSPCQAMWVADGEVMPLDLQATPAVEALARGVELAQLELDNNFTGWQRRTFIEWPADEIGPARSLSMEADSPLDYFVLYSPRGFDHFCAEPVSQCTDWLNLMPRFGRAALGGTEIAPGGTLSATFRLLPRLP